MWGRQPVSGRRNGQPSAATTRSSPWKGAGRDVAQRARRAKKSRSSRPRSVDAGAAAWCSAASAPQSAPARRSPSTERTWSSMRRSSSVGRREAHAAHLREPRRARRIAQLHGAIDVLRAEPAEPRREQPFAGRGEVLEQRIGVDGVRIGQVGQARQPVVDALRVAVGDRPHDAALALHVVGIEVAQQAEVQEAHATVRAQQAVVGVRVPGDQRVTPGEPEVEAEDELADAVALGLGQPRDLLRSQPLHVVGDEHPARREVGVHARHEDVGMAAEAALEAALVLGLELVVELVGDQLAHLGQERSPRRARARGASGSGRRGRGCAGRPRSPRPRRGAGP